MKRGLELLKFTEEFNDGLKRFNRDEFFITKTDHPCAKMILDFFIEKNYFRLCEITNFRGALRWKIYKKRFFHVEPTSYNPYLSTKITLFSSTQQLVNLKFWQFYRLKKDNLYIVSTPAGYKFLKQDILNQGLGGTLVAKIKIY